MDVLAKGLRLRHSVLVHTRTKGSKNVVRKVHFTYIPVHLRDIEGQRGLVVVHMGSLDGAFRDSLHACPFFLNQSKRTRSATRKSKTTTAGKVYWGTERSNQKGFRASTKYEIRK